MNAPQQLNDEDLAITKKNRHQYFETAVASASDADREIRAAEARGRERWLREQELRQKIKRTAIGVAILIVIAGGAAIAYFTTK